MKKGKSEKPTLKDAIHAQWNRVVGATLDFVNDVRVAMKQKPIDKLPAGASGGGGALSVTCPIGQALGAEVHKCYLEIPYSNIKIEDLPESLKNRTTVWDSQEPTDVFIELPEIVQLFTNTHGNMAQQFSKPIDPLSYVDLLTADDVRLRTGG